VRLAPVFRTSSMMASWYGTTLRRLSTTERHRRRAPRASTMSRTAGSCGRPTAPPAPAARSRSTSRWRWVPGGQARRGRSASHARFSSRDDAAPSYPDPPFRVRPSAPDGRVRFTRRRAPPVPVPTWRRRQQATPIAPLLPPSLLSHRGERVAAASCAPRADGVRRVILHFSRGDAMRSSGARGRCGRS
jgi:hypothetical protein